MQNIEGFKIEQVPYHAIVFATTSEPDYEMDRTLIAENWPEYGDYTVVHGSHCSCFGFDETEWDAIVYGLDEIKLLLGGWTVHGWGSETKIAPLMLAYLGR